MPEPPQETRDARTQFEEALRRLQLTARELRTSSEASSATVEDLTTELHKGVRHACRNLADSVRDGLSLESSIYVQTLPEVRSPHREPEGFRVLACSAPPQTGIRPWDESPHLYELWFRQGASAPSDTVTDWQSVEPGQPDRRANGNVYVGGLSVALRQGLLPPAANDNMAPDVAGFASLLTVDPIPTDIQRPALEALRTFAYATTTVLEVYDLTKDRLVQRAEHEALQKELDKKFRHLRTFFSGKLGGWSWTPYKS